jgi:hypothetical protein
MTPVPEGSAPGEYRGIVAFSGFPLPEKKAGFFIFFNSFYNERGFGNSSRRRKDSFLGRARRVVQAEERHFGKGELLSFHGKTGPMRSVLPALRGSPVVSAAGYAARNGNGLGEPFGSGKGFEALVDLIAEADLKTGIGHDDTGIDPLILRGFAGSGQGSRP